MKIFIFAIVYVALIRDSSQIDAETFKSYAKECFKNNNGESPQKDEVKLMMENGKELTDEEKCMVSCMMKRLSIMMEDGKMNVEGIKGLIAEIPNLDEKDKRIMDAVAEECEKEVELSMENHCENAAVIGNCLAMKFKQKGLKMPEHTH